MIKSRLGMMKTLLLILVLSIPAFAQITTHYDKFKDASITSYGDNVYIKSKGRDIMFYAFYIEEQGHKQYWIRFTDRSHLRLNFDDNHNLIFLIDGERIEFGRGSYKVDNDKYGLKESMSYVASKEDMDLIANGKDVQFQLGTCEATLSEKQKKGVKELLEKGK